MLKDRKKKIMLLGTICFSICLYAGPTPNSSPKAKPRILTNAKYSTPPIIKPGTSNSVAPVIPPRPNNYTPSVLLKLSKITPPALPPRPNEITPPPLPPRPNKAPVLPLKINNTSHINPTVKLRRQKPMISQSNKRGLLSLNLLTSDNGQKAFHSGRDASLVANRMQDLSTDTASIKNQIKYSNEKVINAELNGKIVSYSQNNGKYSDIKSALATDVGSKYNSNGNRITRSENLSPLVLAQFPPNGRSNYKIPEFLNMVKGEKIKKIIVLVSKNEMYDIKVDELQNILRKSQLSYFSPESGMVIHKNSDTGTNISVTSELISDKPVQSSDKLSNLREKKYKLTMVEDGKSSEIEIVHFDGWSDHSAVTTKALLSMVGQLGNDKSTLIHCSAGVGRAGTFAAGKIMYDQYRQGQKVDVVNVIRKLREERSPTAIQNKEQEDLLIEFAQILNTSETNVY